MKAERAVGEPGGPIPSWILWHSDRLAIGVLGAGEAMKVMPLFFAAAFAFSLEQNLRQAVLLTGDHRPGRSVSLASAPPPGAATVVINGEPAAGALVFRDRYGVDLQSLTKRSWRHVTSEIFPQC